MKPKVTAAIASIDEHAWQSIRYPKAIWEESELRWISDAQVAEVPFVAFTGLDFFGTPADALVEMLREHVVIEIEVGGHSVTAPDLLFALWRSVVPENDDATDGRSFESVLVARAGYYG